MEHQVETADNSMLMERSGRGNSAAVSYVRSFFRTLDAVRRAQRDTRYEIAMNRGNVVEKRSRLAGLQEEEKRLLRHIGGSKFAQAILRDGPPEARDRLKELFDQHEERCRQLRDLQTRARNRQ